MIGAYVQAPTPRECVQTIQRAEAAGVGAVWMTQAGIAADSLGVLTGAAAVTQRIKLGTSIIPTWPRPPLLLAQQTLAIASLAPGRFRLGIGPSTAAGMESLYGVKWRKPMTQLREYLIVLDGLLHKGEANFEGEFVRTRARTRTPVDVPVMASALSLGAYKLCGQLSDGAISWMCPWPYLRDEALPAMQEGASEAGRERPPLIVHFPVCLSEDRGAVRKALQDQLGRYGTFPVYQAMFARAGYPDVADGYPDGLIDALVAWGSEAAVREKLALMLGEGATEILAHQIFVTEDRRAEEDRFFALLAG